MNSIMFTFLNKGIGGFGAITSFSNDLTNAAGGCNDDEVLFCANNNGEE